MRAVSGVGGGLEIVELTDDCEFIYIRIHYMLLLFVLI